MRIMVQKYGGTSVKGLERMRLVLDRVQKAHAEGFKVVVALSAMSGETNRLLKMAKEFSPNPDPAELDVLVTTGEQVSVSLFAILCKDAGLRARSLLGFQIPITTNSNFTRARIMEIDTERLRGLLEDHDVLVVAGFQGVDCLGRPTTLGRGGSDTTGVALAAALDAEVCEIYTDVNGVYTTDPNLCSTARKLERISYDEMLEFSSMGPRFCKYARWSSPRNSTCRFASVRRLPTIPAPWSLWRIRKWKTCWFRASLTTRTSAASRSETSSTARAWPLPFSPPSLKPASWWT